LAVERADSYLGFFRTRGRASQINQRTKAATHKDARAFQIAVARVTLQLESLLQPLLAHGKSSTGWNAIKTRQTLRRIVETAGNLNRSLRATADVVYQWTSTFKDEEFDPSRMECYNLRHMIDESPYDKSPSNGRPILREGREKESEAIVQVVCFPGLVAYRQYGGELGKRELEADQARRSGMPADVQRRYPAQSETQTGFRTRTICKSIVHLVWGQQRLLTKEAGTSNHINAMAGKNGMDMKRYENDSKGCVELFDVYQEMLKGKSVAKQEDEFVKKASPGRSWPLRRS
jgi:hypothetical protein